MSSRNRRPNPAVQEESANRVVCATFLGESGMLKWALFFLVISIIAGLFGFTGISAAAAGIAKILFVIFIIVFIVFVILAIAAGNAIF
jgi:uncharacterized membrane protein YtjA (UPF0391 family)